MRTLLPHILLLLSMFVVGAAGRPRSFRFAMAFDSPNWDFGWTFHQNLARIALQNQLTDKYPDMNTTHEFAVLPEDWSADCHPQFKAWAAAGVDLIIASTTSQMACAVNLATMYPNTTVISVPGLPTGLPNYVGVWPRLYQPTYLAGYTAGLMTKAKKVCVSGVIAVPQAIQDVSAFARGVRNADPTVEVHVMGTGQLRAALLEVWIVNQSYALGCDVVWVQSVTIEGTKQANALGMMSIGECTDARQTIGETVLTSLIIDMAPGYLRTIEAMLNGTLRQEIQKPDWWMGWEWGIMSIANFSFLVPRDVRAKVMAQLPTVGQIFCGRVCTKTRCLCNSSSCCLTDAQLNALDSYPDFVRDHGIVQLPGLACKPGQLATWHLKTFTMECSDCPAGTYAHNADQVSECHPCPPATYSPRGATACTACPAGTFSDRPGNGQCPACPAGSIAPDGGALRCTLCPSGLSNSDRTQCETAASVWVYGLAGGLVGGFVLLSLLLLWYARQRGKRNNRAAPKDPAQPFCIVFTDIQSSTALWAVIPDVMARALDAHHMLIRKLIAKHKCYEVKTIGDSFMCATQNPAQALRFALAVQQALARYDWGTDRIDAVYRESGPAEDATPGCWNGLRVRAGIHYGNGDIKLDPISQGYDYYGTVVNTAARIESVCHGGQTGVSEAVFRMLGGTCPGAVWTDLGLQPLRGLAEPLRLYQVLPEGPLSHRRFPPLRIDQPSAKEEELAEAETLAVPQASQPGGRHSPSIAHTNITECTGPTEKWADTHALVLSGHITSDEIRRQYHILQVALTTLLAPLDHAGREDTVKELCTHLHVPNLGTEGPLLARTLHGLINRALPSTILQRPDRKHSASSD